MDYVSRAQWKARRPRQVVRQDRSVGMVVHGSVTGTSDPAAIMRGIQNDHMLKKVPPWLDIAYNWAVSLEGDIYEGRGWGVADGADMGLGKTMFSVCYLGRNEAGDAAKQAINRVIAEHDRRYGAGIVKGHGEINKTTCPDSNLQSWINNGRPTAAVAPTPVVEEEEEEMTVIGWDPRQSQWYHVHGNVAVRITPQAANAMKFIGVRDVGQLHPQFLEAMHVVKGGLG